MKQLSPHLLSLWFFSWGGGSTSTIMSETAKVWRESSCLFTVTHVLDTVRQAKKRGEQQLPCTFPWNVLKIVLRLTVKWPTATWDLSLHKSWSNCWQEAMFAQQGVLSIRAYRNQFMSYVLDWAWKLSQNLYPSKFKDIFLIKFCISLTCKPCNWN